jgi:hypothetical protein
VVYRFLGTKRLWAIRKTNLVIHARQATKILCYAATTEAYSTFIVQGPLASTQNRYMPSSGTLIALEPSNGPISLTNPMGSTDAPFSLSRSTMNLASP